MQELQWHINSLLLVRAYREGGYYEDAKRMLQDSVEEAQQSSSPQDLLVPLFRELSLVEAELGNNAGVVEARFQLATCLQMQGNLQQASHHFEEAINSFSKLHIMLCRGQWILGRGQALLKKLDIVGPCLGTNATPKLPNTKMAC